ncbi:MAG TPA: DUF86 domain-containing protein [Methanoregulaceae archaeon]|nr:DUF86 domain-containing protein [Methanoregulaceae archaeon]
MAVAAEKILDYSSGISFDELSSDELRKDAILRNIQVLGDAAKSIPQEFKSLHQELDWKGVSGLRDIITHQYFRVDWSLIWTAIGADLPLLASQLRDIVEQQQEP